MRTDAAGDTAKIVSHCFHGSGTRTRVLSRGAHQIDFVGGLYRPFGRNLNAARNFLCCRALLGDGGCYRAADVADFTNCMFDPSDGRYRALGCTLHPGNLRTNFLSGPARLAGERFYFTSNHREPTASLAGTGRLDGGVERKQIGLLGNVSDELDHIADARGCLVQLLDRNIGGFRPH